MKKVILFFLTLFVASSVWAQEETFEIDGVRYHTYTYDWDNGDFEASVYRVPSDKQGTFIIPKTVEYKGYTLTVNSIFDQSFEYCTDITSVIIPEGVTRIGNYAFANCSSLTSITIPEGVTSIGLEAFKGCKSLTSISIPESVTKIGSSAFTNCSSLTSITIPNGVTSIGDEKDRLNGRDGTFAGCTNLKTIVIPNSVTYIGRFSFEGTSLTSVSIPESMTEIGDCAFANCSSLTSIKISESVTKIDRGAFYGCSGLTSIKIPEGVTSIGTGAFSECTGLTSISIPESVTSIGTSAFEGCIGLTSISIPESVTSIETGAFKGCIGLTSISIPESVTSIGSSAFTNCSNLTSITINGATSFDEEVFTGCTKLKDVTCLSTTPPEAYANTFENYNGYLHVLCESKDDYDFANCWGSFKHVECIGSETVELTKDEVKVEPERSEAVFTMPQNESANSYTLTIQNNGVTFCTLTFNAQGQLSNIDFSTTKSYELKASVSAYQFTVTGLSEATDYGYSFKALASNKSVLKEYTGSFTTKNGDGTGGSSQGGAEVGGGSGQGGEGGEQGGEGGNQTAINGVSNATTVAIVNNQILVNGEAPAFVVTVSGKKIANQNLKSGVYFVVVEGETVGVSVR